jgi:hypothetical protein
MRDDTELAYVRCNCLSCINNFCPDETNTCMRKFVNINQRGQCDDFFGKAVNMK